jgi:cytochrome c
MKVASPLSQFIKWEANEDVAARLLAAGLSLLVGGACQASPPAVPTPKPVASSAARAPLTPAPGVAGNPELGRELIVARGCGGCHTVPGVTGANGVVGPRLNNTALRSTLAGEEIPNSPDVMARWILDPPSVKPGTPMPRVGVTEQEAQDITAYLYSQSMNPGAAP